MYVLMNNVVNEHDIKRVYLEVNDDFLTIIRWTFDITKAKVFDTMHEAEEFVNANEEYLNKNFDADNIFIAELVPNIRYYLGNFGKNRVG